MTPPRTDIRYRDLEKRLGWTGQDERTLAGLEPQLQELPSTLMEEILGAVEARPAPVGAEGEPGPAQLIRELLDAWMQQLFSGPYDREYVGRLWEIGLLQAEVDLAMRRMVTLLLLRLRSALVSALAGRSAGGSPGGLEALQRRLDLDLAVIHDGWAAGAERDPWSSERVATLQQITGGLAHELRQPLNAIRSSAYFLEHVGALDQGEAIPSSKTAEHLGRIQRQVEYADQIIRALSAFSSLRAPAAAPLSIGDCVEEALRRNPLPRGVEVSLEHLQDAPAVLADPGQLLIVVGNLLRNAGEAMADGGSLDIVVRQVGDEVEIAISDTGCGIPAADLPRVLEPLFTTKPRGTGLGLAISRLILESLGGRIAVESESGRGTTFTLSLPAAASGAQPRAGEAPA